MFNGQVSRATTFLWWISQCGPELGRWPQKLFPALIVATKSCQNSVFWGLHVIGFDPSGESGSVKFLDDIFEPSHDGDKWKKEQNLRNTWIESGCASNFWLCLQGLLPPLYGNKDVFFNNLVRKTTDQPTIRMKIDQKHIFAMFEAPRQTWIVEVPFLKKKKN